MYKKIWLIFLLVIILYFARTFFIPVAIGGLFATLFLPFCIYLEKKKISKGFAVIICLFVCLLGIAVVGFLIAWQVSNLVDDFANLKDSVIQMFDNIQQFIFTHLGIPIDLQSEIFKSEKPSYTYMFSTISNSLFGLFTLFIFTLTYFVALLYYRNHLKQFLLKLVSDKERLEMNRVIDQASRVSQQYLIGLLKMIVLLWIMYGIGFSILGVKNAVFFAILCGLLETVPYIGNITGTSLTVMVAAANGGNTAMLVGIILVYGFVQFVQGWILEPLIVGKQVKINPLFTIVALIVGELIWGIAGVFLAIPLIAVLKIVFDHIESLKPFGFLIGEVSNNHSHDLNSKSEVNNDNLN